jgi:hypothetical protein
VDVSLGRIAVLRFVSIVLIAPGTKPYRVLAKLYFFSFFSFLYFYFYFHTVYGGR